MAINREEIIAEIYERMNAMKRSIHSHTQTMFEDCPISRSQLEFLFTIKHMQPVSFKQVAERLYLTPGAVSQLADPMLEKGFISRKTDPADRRVQCLHLTKRGEKVLQEIEKRRHDSMKRVMDSLTTEELVVWAQVQEKLITHIHADSSKDTKK